MALDDLGTRIAMRRQQLGWTQKDLAARVRVDKSTVVNWETGKHYPKRYLGALEAALGVNLRDGNRVFTYTSQDEAYIWSLRRFDEDERHALIRALRQLRGGSS